ncbi:hypothetical protein CAPTEDRAFT_151760 [Capitella teleta]|uniref:Very-long-chain (3R)-3-hydroxyacyl-CoA dehydratase n=1 Tax=Capitella teleta TaxID=283909 RepID=R7TBR6_CAPTE|nr:hypothetical protein CAPTEDRAFT_151760 [Capitella teleta]|eukprot:ELT88541.1 hypothetical protein CAPTEDRAFT_151760 [Capitella teleta]
MPPKKPDDYVNVTTSLAYLLVYNFAQVGGWTMIAFAMGLKWVAKGSYTDFYGAVEPMLLIFQTAAILEIFHAMFGLVKSNPVLTAFQVFSRIIVTWGILYIVPEVHQSVGVAMLLVAWSVTEIIRYSYYMCGLIDSIPYALMWCRYTFFIILYPIGVTGELLSIYGALPFIKDRGLYSVSMPNRANMSFSYYHVLIFVMLSYIPIFPQLYLHMFAQRRKMVSASPKPKAE